MKNLRLIGKKVEEAVREASFSLRKDVLGLIKKAHRDEKNKRAKLALGWIIENAEVAKKEKLALCQDTGFALVFIEVGQGMKASLELVKTIEESVMYSYINNNLRKSMVDPFLRINPSHKKPLTHIEFNPQIKDLHITVFPNGFGSENKTRLRMFNPTASIKDIEDFVIETVKLAGPGACPPFIVGVGIGGTSDYALLLAKKALVGKLNKPNKDKLLANLENRLLKRINSLNIGPMGFGGKNTALAVKIEKSPTHIAGLPVGINVSCWALRSATVKIKN